MDTVLESLAQLQQEFENSLPPVDQWHPELNGDLDMRIDREGGWHYQGDKIQRAPMVKLFSSILRKEGEDYYLVTPVEKWRIKVDAEPFVAVSVRQIEGNLVFQTNIGNEVVASKEHPIAVQDDAAGNPYPTVIVQRGFTGLIARSAFYQLAEMADLEGSEGCQEMAIYSGGERFVLGSV